MEDGLCFLGGVFPVVGHDFVFLSSLDSHFMSHVAPCCNNWNWWSIIDVKAESNVWSCAALGEVSFILIFKGQVYVLVNIGLELVNLILAFVNDILH